MPRHTLLSGACAVLAALASPRPAGAQDDAIDRSPVDCLSVSRVRSTEVVDDRTILFYMRGRTVYLNELSNDCPRLASEDRFSYQARGGRLCDIDTITVIESFGGLQRGATCRLGEFIPITRAEAAEIEAGPEGAQRAGQVEAEEVELPDEDGGSEQADDGGATDAPSDSADE